jgi:hypothetical protein
VFDRQVAAAVGDASCNSTYLTSTGARQVVAAGQLHEVLGMSDLAASANAHMSVRSGMLRALRLMAACCLITATLQVHGVAAGAGRH